MFYDDDADLGKLDGKTVAIIGYGSQGHAHSLNLKDSGVSVVVGLRPDSPSVAKAKDHGLRVADPADAASEGDIVMMLVPDELHGQVWESGVKDGIASGNALLFGHGFSIHYEQIVPPPDVDVALVAPKGPGHLVRRQYLEGSGVPGPCRRRPGRERRRAGPGAGLRQGDRQHPRRRDRDHLQGRDRDRPVRRAGRPLRRRHRARPRRLRDARGCRLRPAPGVLRVPARAQADRRSDVREGDRRDALLDLQHRRVRRSDARASG